MRPGLGQEIGKAGDPGPLADDVEQIAMLACGAIGELAGGTRSGRRPGQPHEEGAAGVVLQIAHDPPGPFPPSGGKVSATHAFGILRKGSDHLFGFGLHGSPPPACVSWRHRTASELTTEHAGAHSIHRADPTQSPWVDLEPLPQIGRQHFGDREAREHGTGDRDSNGRRNRREIGHRETPE